MAVVDLFGHGTVLLAWVLLVDYRSVLGVHSCLRILLYRMRSAWLLAISLVITAYLVVCVRRIQGQEQKECDQILGPRSSCVPAFHIRSRTRSFLAPDMDLDVCPGGAIAHDVRTLSSGVSPAGCSCAISGVASHIETIHSNGADVIHGSPIDEDIHSINFLPLLMAAHQTLDTPIDTDNFGELDLTPISADKSPGEIDVGVVLTDSATKRSQYLGKRPLSSSMVHEFSIRGQVEEKLRFQVPPAKLSRFDEITVLIVPAIDRSFAGARVAVKQFELIPRSPEDARTTRDVSRGWTGIVVQQIK